jgi:hypothetical protein
MDELQNNLLARLDERQKAMDGKIDAILIQTTKTNGRLSKAEEDIQNINLWKAKLKGYYSGILIIVAALGVIIGWFFK